MQEIRKRLVVAGGGPAGICAALAAARLGIDTVLVGDRPVYDFSVTSLGLEIHSFSGGTATVTLALYGWEYKHRGPRPKTPPPIDPAAVQAALNAALPDGLSVIAVQDHGTKITVKIKEEFYYG